MNSRQPPVPPANRAPHGAKPEQPNDTQGQISSQTVDPDKIGQQGNSKINTTHQGYQQDR
ncbi:hypothetical protein BJF92_14975 [Rhizobium rhizosphaerae]|uniref:Uncharacterized protein n=1 Tax=Xaviernesmea rhizosphaerae TaxID=1672749 RepID=A0A1Q9ACT4_9HYPH|nr:hypothetical protein [Xaviernesmea rhizosphaerae]OLP52704.1 hypothetical protein BJF92_14975 [Xaviernesmea rhizosphaerae]OQP85427.1 hypothetical protein BTR14_16175 [Xaviernesmea rhizosphaerae]